MKSDESSTRLAFVVGENFILLPGTEARSVNLLVGLTAAAALILRLPGHLRDQ